VIGLQKACTRFFAVRGDVQQLVAEFGLDFYTFEGVMQPYMRRVLEAIDCTQLGDAAAEARHAEWEAPRRPLEEARCSTVDQNCRAVLMECGWGSDELGTQPITQPAPCADQAD